MPLIPKLQYIFPINDDYSLEFLPKCTRVLLLQYDITRYYFITGLVFAESIGRSVFVQKPGL